MNYRFTQSASLFLMLCTAISLVLISGCSSEVDKIESLVGKKQQDWEEIIIDRFTIAVLVADDPTKQPDFSKYQESVALHFTLLCLVEPEDVSKVTSVLQDKKGQLSNEVISTCRNSSLIDLADPDFRLIRAHLRDFTEDLVGPGLVKRYIFSQVSLERY